MSLSHWLGQPGFCPRFKEFLERNTTGHFSSINCARVDFLADVIDFKTATSSMRLAKAHFLWQNYLSECPNSNPDLPANLKRRVKKLLWADESGMDPQGLINETTFDALQDFALLALAQFHTEFRQSSAFSELEERSKHRIPRTLRRRKKKTENLPPTKSHSAALERSHSSETISSTSRVANRWRFSSPVSITTTE